ncbi:MAG: hypothetical protein M2R45_05261 [Verrucomicrobia subdivision 3 bacterium]|nr:hypothetical protein [Limisphaerales bacterium]MCS1416859.1 hypothetical protein [Limisphaerales bacterium]
MKGKPPRAFVRERADAKAVRLMTGADKGLCGMEKLSPHDLVR